MRSSAHNDVVPPKADEGHGLGLFGLEPDQCPGRHVERTSNVSFWLSARVGFVLRNAAHDVGWRDNGGEGFFFQSGQKMDDKTVDKSKKSSSHSRRERQ